MRSADLSLSDDTLAYLFIHEMTDLSVQTHQDPKSVLPKSQRQVQIGLCEQIKQRYHQIW